MQAAADWMCTSNKSNNGRLEALGQELPNAFLCRPIMFSIAYSPWLGLELVGDCLSHSGRLSTKLNLGIDFKLHTPQKTVCARVSEERSSSVFTSSRPTGDCGLLWVVVDCR